jgi:simple sugar transport system substrate-binding protein
MSDMSDGNRKVTRRSLLGAAGAAGAGAALLPNMARAAVAAAHASPPPWVNWVKSFEKKPVKIAVSCFGTLNPFFTPSRVATADAGGQLGIQTLWTGTQNTDTARQISQFRDLIRSGYNAIVLIPGEADPWLKPIKEAMDKGVLVLTANQDSPKSARELFFGQDLYAGGITQAQLIAKFLGHKRGKVASTNCAPGSDAMFKREGGAKAGLKKLGFTVVSEVPTDPTDPAKNLSQVENIMRAHPDLVALAPGCAPDTASAGKAKQRLRKKNLVIVGHDLLSDTLQLIKKGVIEGTLGQNPYAQVYLPIMYAYQRVVLDAPKLTLPGGNWFTGTEVVTRANVDKYITREKRFAKA